MVLTVALATQRIFTRLLLLTKGEIVRTLFFTVIVLLWFSFTAYAACVCKCKFVQEYVISVSSGGVCGTRYVLRKGSVYKCMCAKVPKGKQV